MRKLYIGNITPETNTIFVFTNGAVFGILEDE